MSKDKTARRPKRPRQGLIAGSLVDQSSGSKAGLRLAVVVPEGRHYSCQDCPARCCTSPWGIPVTPEEYERIVSDEEARARLGERGARILKAGVLPMREQNQGLACVFLDDDLLCSLHKRRGHAFIPAPCQAYPFGFSENESGAPVALLSRYCPSIRDNAGEPLTREILLAKLDQAGGAREMAPAMGLRSGRVIDAVHVGTLAERFRELLLELPSVADALVSIYALLDRFDEELPKKKALTPEEVQVTLEKAEESLPQTVSRATGSAFNVRMLLSYLLGGLSYPSRVLLAHRLRPIRFTERLRSFGNRLAWLFGVGTVQLYLLPRPVRVRSVARVPGFLGSDLAPLVSDYLAEVLSRRQGMAKQTYLTRVVVDLGLMAVIISRFARASAASHGRPVVWAEDVREGIGIAELLFSHQGDGAQGALLQSLRLKLMSDPEDFSRLLSAEV